MGKSFYNYCKKRDKRNRKMNNKTCSFTSGGSGFWCSFGEIKFDFTLKKIQYPPFTIWFEYACLIATHLNTDRI